MQHSSRLGTAATIEANCRESRQIVLILQLSGYLVVFVTSLGLFVVVNEKNKNGKVYIGMENRPISIDHH
jgi:hypothetical protein